MFTDPTSVVSLVNIDGTPNIIDLSDIVAVIDGKTEIQDFPMVGRMTLMVNMLL